MLDITRQVAAANELKLHQNTSRSWRGPTNYLKWMDRKINIIFEISAPAVLFVDDVTSKVYVRKEVPAATDIEQAVEIASSIFFFQYITGPAETLEEAEQYRL